MTETETKSKVEEILSKPYVLLLHNDDHNSFQHVIMSLVTICGHDVTQAEQCAHIVHFNGKCDVKHGDYDTISDMKTQLINQGLSVTMEVN